MRLCSHGYSVVSVLFAYEDEGPVQPGWLTDEVRMHSAVICAEGVKSSVGGHEQQAHPRSGSGIGHMHV